MTQSRRFLSIGVATAVLAAALAAGPDEFDSAAANALRALILMEAHAQEVDDDDDDDDDDEDDIGGDGVGDEDPGNDGAGGDDIGGDDVGGDDVGGDDVGGDDDGPGGDDDGPGGDDDGPGGDDDGPGGDDDDGPGGDDGGGSPGGGGGQNDDDDDDDDNEGAAAGGGSGGVSARRGGSDDDEAPGGAGVRGAGGGGDLRLNDGDDDRSRASLPEGVDLDDEGRWVRAGEVLALEADPTDLELARSLGFQVEERHRLDAIGLSVVQLRAPRGVNAREALNTLREADPDTAYDFNHLYAPMQTASRPANATIQRQSSGGGAAAASAGLLIGMIDSAVTAAHPSLRRAPIEQRDFVDGGGARPSAHGTAVASLLTGDDGSAFSGAAPRARVLAAGVVASGDGQMATAESMVRALDWLIANGTPVINVSLAGPPNALLADAIRRAQARGAVLVAAVGNDGPAAPPLYPASYSGVVGVTAVDDRGSIYRRAGRGAQVDVSAPGVGVLAAEPGGQYVEVSGTSFAAPAVAAWIAARHSRLDPTSAQTVVATLSANARDAGDPGPDPVYGVGILVNP